MHSLAKHMSCMQYLLPLLYTVEDIRSLSGRHSKLYHQEHGLSRNETRAVGSERGNSQEVEQRKVDIARYIGCRSFEL